MARLPDEVNAAWEHHEGPVILTTVDKSGMPNAIYATCVGRFGDDRLVVADNYFEKTRANILAGSKATLLFITKEKKAYQVKGPVEYHRDGPVFDDMKKWNPKQHPGHAAAAVRIEDVYAGSKKLL